MSLKTDHPREYDCWRHMVARCTNPGHRQWRNYGGRGISVCERWLGPEGFKHFLDDMGLRPSREHSIDRYPDNDGTYCKDNCRWATSKQQMNNTRLTTILSIGGKKVPLTEAVSQAGINYNTAVARMKSGLSVERALFSPVVTHPTYHIDGRDMSLSEASRAHGLPAGTVAKRLRRGWSLRDALAAPRRTTSEPKPILMVVDGHKVSLHSECKRRGLDYSVAWYFVRQRGMTAKQALARLSFRRAT